MREIARTRINKSHVTTVPSAVRKFLNLDWEDEISWQIEGENVIVVKAEPGEKPSG